MIREVKGRNTLISWRFSPRTGEPEVDSCVVVNVYPKDFLKALNALGSLEVKEKVKAEADTVHAFFLRHRYQGDTRLLILKDLAMTASDAEFLIKEVLSRERLLELSR